MSAPTPAVPPPSGHACETCPSRGGSWERLGIRPGSWDYLVALAGNPNTGKTTVFNSLTGLRMHTGNWPGKTISRAEGGFAFNGQRYKLVDLPGTYSLLSASPDEEVARDFILFGRPDVTVIVADATCLERNLNLTLQILQITRSVVVCLNLMDEARANRIEIDVRNLARDLGVPVVPCAIRRGEGLPELLHEISAVARREVRPQPYQLQLDIPGLRGALRQIEASLASLYPQLPQARWVALRLLEGDRQVIEALRSGELGKILADPNATELAPGSSRSQPPTSTR